MSSSTSTNTGVAPNQATTSAVAAKVKLGQSTACRVQPLRHQHQAERIGAVGAGDACLAPQKPDSAISSSRTSGPMM